MSTAGEFFKAQMLAPENTDAYWTIKLVTGRELFSKIDRDKSTEKTSTTVVALRPCGGHDHPTYLNLDHAVTIQRANALKEEE